MRNFKNNKNNNFFNSASKLQNLHKILVNSKIDAAAEICKKYTLNLSKLTRGVYSQNFEMHHRAMRINRILKTPIRFRKIMKPKFISNPKLFDAFFNMQFINRLKIVFTTLTQNFEQFLGRRVKFAFHFLPYNRINVHILLRYVIFRLEQFNTFNEIVYPLFRFLKNRIIFSGIRVRCFGRMTRQQRASNREAYRGGTPFNNYGRALFFAFGIAILKYGVTSVRIWLVPENATPIGRNVKLVKHFQTFRRRMKNRTHLKLYLL